MSTTNADLTNFATILDARKHGAYLRGRMAARGHRHDDDPCFSEKDREALRAFTMADQGWLNRSSPELAAFNCGYGSF